MATSLKQYARRVATLREAMEATLEQWREDLEDAEKLRSQTAINKIEEKISGIEEAISTLETLEMELEA